MSRLLESIRIENQQALNLAYHQSRVNLSQKSNLQRFKSIDLKQILKQKLPYLNPNIVYKCRILYTTQIEKIEFHPYQIRPIQSLKMVESFKLFYSDKWENRKKINELFAQKGNCDDVLIIKNGWVTDSSYANILFFDREQWWTPSTPLLAGTQRAKLLEEKRIFERPIRPSDLKKYQSFKLVNAMIPFDLAKIIPISHIQ